MSQRGSWTRSRLERSDALSQGMSSPNVEPLPPPRPLWKQELTRKLEGYRDRQKTARETKHPAPEALAKLGQAWSRTESSPISFGKASAGGAGAAAAPAPAREKPANSNWRKVSKTGAELRLPPLKKPAPASGETSEAPSAKASQPAPRRTTEVVSSAPVAPIAIRALAGVLDLSVILVALGVFVGVFSLMGGVALPGKEGFQAMAFAFFAIISFYWIFYIRYLGETTGMTWLGLRVLNFDGQPPTDAQRRARALGTILSTASLGLGFAWSVADEERLSWHDRISKTFVTRGGSTGFQPRAQNETRQTKRLPPLKPPPRD